MLDVLVDVMHEIRVTKRWFRSDRIKHPYEFRTEVARRKSPQFAQSGLGELRTHGSPHFADHLGAFIELVDRLVILRLKKYQEHPPFLYVCRRLLHPMSHVYFPT